MSKSFNFTVPDISRPERVDILITDLDKNLSRSSLKNRIETLRCNGNDIKLSRKVQTGDLIFYELTDEVSTEFKAEKIDFDIIYENENVIVINKLAGMVVHPAAGNYTGTLAQGLKYYLSETDSDFTEEDTRPGIVHRLDKDTSGILITAKNTSSLHFLSDEFRERRARKTYLAVIHGKLPAIKGEIKTLINRDRNDRKKMTVKTGSGREAHTEYRVLKVFKQYSFVALYPKTGRTHQLRVHMKSMGTPICGDPVYSSKKDPFGFGLSLHAYKLRIRVPENGSEKESVFRAPLPERFKIILMDLSKRD